MHLFFYAYFLLLFYFNLCILYPQYIVFHGKKLKIKIKSITIVEKIQLQWPNVRSYTHNSQVGVDNLLLIC